CSPRRTPRVSRSLSSRSWARIPMPLSAYPLTARSASACSNGSRTQSRSCSRGLRTFSRSRTRTIWQRASQPSLRTTNGERLMPAMFIRVDMTREVAGDRELANKLAEVCPVNIFFAQAPDGSATIVKENLDECVLCEPCVEAPTGDFFGVGHGVIREFWSLPLTMSPRDGRGFNCYFPMPFNRDARVELTNEGDRRLVVYFYIDYETFERPLENVGLFHAQWRSEYPTVGWGDDDRRFEDEQDYRREVFSTPNMSGEDNYVILEAEGRGQYVGCNLNVDCRRRLKNDW